MVPSLVSPSACVAPPLPTTTTITIASARKSSTVSGTDVLFTVRTASQGAVPAQPYDPYAQMARGDQPCKYWARTVTSGLTRCLLRCPLYLGP